MYLLNTIKTRINNHVFHLILTDIKRRKILPRNAMGSDTMQIQSLTMIKHELHVTDWKGELLFALD